MTECRQDPSSNPERTESISPGLARFREGLPWVVAFNPHNPARVESQSYGRQIQPFPDCASSVFSPGIFRGEFLTQRRKGAKAQRVFSVSALLSTRIAHFRQNSRSSNFPKKPGSQGSVCQGNGRRRLADDSPDHHSPDFSPAFFLNAKPQSREVAKKLFSVSASLRLCVFELKGPYPCHPWLNSFWLRLCRSASLRLCAFALKGLFLYPWNLRNPWCMSFGSGRPRCVFRGSNNYSGEDLHLPPLHHSITPLPHPHGPHSN
jgi:hypothetical protein